MYWRIEPKQENPNMVARRQTSAFDPGRSIEVHGVRVPSALVAVAQALEASHSLLELEDDWDGEGAAGFSEQTWRRAADFVAQGTTQLLDRNGIATDDIETLPAADGALGIDWRTARCELLVTVPADANTDALFYGDDGSGRRKIKGTLDTSAPNRWLTEWLAE
jgi:hypothetical protein